ncbi:hypothetical protein E2C01_060761 [Portunus trituberculatus]|uniref:Uncharacterized protein n=1 Tax=Portunus trituberculatus TaxID=210409 RepID=A0A5B7H233_PORTR|nr:hypothetical protein [Portunus trituberculatus]
MCPSLACRHPSTATDTASPTPLLYPTQSSPPPPPPPREMNILALSLHHHHRHCHHHHYPRERAVTSRFSPPLYLSFIVGITRLS